MSNTRLKLYPSSHGVALAIVIASGLTCENPEHALTHPKGNLARMIAMAALIDCLPGIPPARVTACFGSAYQAVATARRASGWRQDWVEVVCEALATLAPPHAPESARKPAVLIDEDLLARSVVPVRVAGGGVALGEPCFARSALAGRRLETEKPWRMKSISAVSGGGDA